MCCRTGNIQIAEVSHVIFPLLFLKQEQTKFDDLLGHREWPIWKSCPNFLRSIYVIPMTLIYKVIWGPYKSVPPPQQQQQQQQQLGPLLDLTAIAAGKKKLFLDKAFF